MIKPTGSHTSLLVLERITKRFGGVTALDNVAFDLRQGEIHALLGENGAGKSTLIKILAGVYTPDAGIIRIDDQIVHIRDVADADRFGIRVIHQELSLAPNLSAAENIYLGREPTRCGWLDRRKMDEDAQILIEQLGMSEIRDVGATVSDLSVAQRQLVEIARALSCQAKILVLDEPTSSLAEAETEALFSTLKRLRSQSVGIIYISHRLEEITRLADRITVLRDGRSMGTQTTAHIHQRELIKWMVGRDIVDHFHRPPHKPGNVALEVNGLVSSKIHDVSFQLHYGEILGLAGLVGSGRSELARAIFGIDPFTAGEIRIDGKPIVLTSPRAALDAGIVLVPEDRRKEGLVMIQSVGFNISLPWTAEWISFCTPNERKRIEIIDHAVNNFEIKLDHINQCIDGLSGGNQQKVLVGRWMEHLPKILILDEPTRGIDVGAREEMFNFISDLVEQGVAILFISSDLAEVINVCHHVALYRDGHILKTVTPDAISLETIMEQLTGARIHETD
ncbi:MAG: sugar ABC transporter ATP-binding protein [Candidatus Omnitrophota bacterium]|jgi:ABC-type sugar transport system ATPase subunit|nr:MAG: sugar ABC transporter ATP-binding protein [Candidatus Omnitrophota bacterium]